MAKMLRKPKRQGVVKRRDVTYSDLKGITVEDAINKIALIYRTEGYRTRTVNDYVKYYNEMIQIIKRSYIHQITEQDIRHYIDHLLNKRELSPVTVNIRLASLRSVFNRILHENMINESPFKNIRKLKTDEQKIYSLTDKQIRRLFSVVDTDTFAGFRDYVAMMTMLRCGLRINEINTLEIDDLDFDNFVIMLPGAKNKNRKNRAVPMTSKVATLLKQLIAEEQEYFGTDITHVFTNQYGEPLRDDLIRKRMDKYSKVAELKNECRASPHSLRHSFAIAFMKSPYADIKALQKIMGHADIESTQIYLNYTNDDVRDKYRKVFENDSLDDL